MSNTTKNKGGQKSWATDQQKEWLVSKLPSFVASRSNTSPGEFWPGLFEEWFQEWPLEDSEDGAGLEMEVRLKRKKAVSDVEVHSQLLEPDRLLPATQGLV